MMLVLEHVLVGVSSNPTVQYAPERGQGCPSSAAVQATLGGVLLGGATVRHDFPQSKRSPQEATCGALLFDCQGTSMFAFSPMLPRLMYLLAMQETHFEVRGMRMPHSEARRQLVTNAPSMSPLFTKFVIGGAVYHCLPKCLHHPLLFFRMRFFVPQRNSISFVRQTLFVGVPCKFTAAIVVCARHASFSVSLCAFTMLLNHYPRVLLYFRRHVQPDAIIALLCTFTAHVECLGGSTR